MGAEGDLSVGNRYWGCLFKIVVEKLFLYSALFCIRFLLLFGLGECIVDVVVQCISICSIIFLHEGGREHQVEESWGGKNTHSILEGVVPCPMCISRPSRAK